MVDEDRRDDPDAAQTPQLDHKSLCPRRLLRLRGPLSPRKPRETQLCRARVLEAFALELIESVLTTSSASLVVLRGVVMLTCFQH
jgi:hypothetical protein